MTDRTFEDYSKYGFHRQVKFRGLYDWDGLYKFCQNWLNARDYDFYNTFVKDKHPYQIYKIKGLKKLNFYCMVMIYVDFWMWDTKVVEIIKDGKKVKMSEGYIKIIFSAGFVTDYDGDFEKSPGSKKMEYFLNNYIFYHENLLKYFDYMDYHLYDFMTDVKKYLQMQSGQNAW